MKYSEIINIFSESHVTPQIIEKWFIGEDDEDLEVLQNKVGKINLVYQFGGEGKGDTYTLVIHLLDHDVYIRMDGYYDSNNGRDFSDAEFFEVIPTEKKITVYEKGTKGVKPQAISDSSLSDSSSSEY